MAIAPATAPCRATASPSTRACPGPTRSPPAKFCRWPACSGWHPAAHAGGQAGVEHRPAPQCAVDEFLRPAPVACVERSRVPIEGGVEQFAATKRRQDLRRCRARIRHPPMGRGGATRAWTVGRDHGGNNSRCRLGGARNGDDARTTSRPRDHVTAPTRAPVGARQPCERRTTPE